MSSMAKISGRRRIDSHDNTFVIQECFTPIFQPENPEQIPFPEFLDSDINNEKWEQAGEEKFQDIFATHLPPSIEAHDWKSIQDIFPDANLNIRSETANEYPDLVRGSTHLLHSEFVRSFISSIETLYYLANTRVFPVEHTSPQFFPNFERDRWRPWFHIYSMCKSGKTAVHQPMVNRLGKYVVRLFWLGSWRKVYVSDKVPINSNNQIMLPSIVLPEEESLVQQSSKELKAKTSRRAEPVQRKRIIEIWPFLLSKALMILASLTWTSKNELMDFDIIHCLTALQSYEVWQTCLDYTDQYTWPEGDKTSGAKIAVAKSSSKFVEKESKISNKRQTSKTSITKLSSVIGKDDKNRYAVIVGIELENSFDEIDETQAPSRQNNWTHGMLVTQTRTVPLLKPSTDEEFEAWKRFRWIDWAIEHNLINPRCPPKPIKSFKTVDPFRYSYVHLMPKQSSPQASFHQESDSNVLGFSGKGKKDKRSSIQDFKDITEWLDLENVEQCLSYINIYYMASTYKCKARISNLSCENISKELKYPYVKNLQDLQNLQWKEIILPLKPNNHRNEPLYIFCDSICPQRVVIQLNQTGNLNSIREHPIEEETMTSEVISECGLCVSTFLERVKRNTLKKIEPVIEYIPPLKKVIPNDPQCSTASITIADFKWDSNRKDIFVTSFSTYGSKCLVLDVPAGRNIYTMWIQVEGPYTVQVVSDAHMCVGSLEEILTLMTNDSLMFKEAYSHLVDTFTLLVQAFGTSEYMLCLNEFHKSFKPDGVIPKHEWLDIQEVFFNTFFETIRNNLGQEALRVVKILFRRWQFKSKNLCNLYDVSELCHPVESEDLVYVRLMQENAIKMQAFFKGIYERILLCHHNPFLRYYPHTAELLRGIAERFTVNSKSLGASVLRKFIQNDTIPGLQNKYAWYKTLSNQICQSQFIYNTKLSEPGWVFIARYIFTVRSAVPLFMRINIFSNLDQYYLHVFDNETLKEKTYHVNNAAVNEYSPSIPGYTVVAYGWAKTDTIPANSKIVFACPQDNIEDLLCFSQVFPKKDIITDIYVPNRCNFIFRYVMCLKSEFTIITMQFSTDYPDVKIKFRIFEKANPDNVLTELNGVGFVTVPALLLINRNENNPEKFAVFHDQKLSMNSDQNKPLGVKRRNSKRDCTDSQSNISGTTSKEGFLSPDYYIVEAFVLENSWPLTGEEWKNVRRERDKHSVKHIIKGEEPPKILSTKISSANTESGIYIKPKDGPRWTIEMYTNNTDSVILYKDPERDEKLKQEKLSWFEKDISKYERGEELRNKFNEENLIENTNIILDPEIRSLDPEVFRENILPPLNLVPLLTKPFEEVIERQLQTPELVWEKAYEVMSRHAYELIDFDKGEKSKTTCMKNQNSSFEKLNIWFDGIRRESEYMMQSSYRKKEKYIENIKQTFLTQAVDKNNKKKEK